MLKKIKLFILQKLLEDYNLQYQNLIYNFSYPNTDIPLTKEEQESLDSLSNKIGTLEEIIEDVKIGF